MKVGEILFYSYNIRAIKGFEEYYKITNSGKVWSIRKNKFLKSFDNGKGYQKVSLSVKGNKKQLYIHRLVASAFIENNNNLPQVNHKDENKKNNCSYNLEWVSVKDNVNYGTHNSRVAETLGKPVEQIDTQTGVVIAVFPSQSEAGRKTGIDSRRINKAVRGKAKTAGGYLWREIPKEKRTQSIE